MRTAYGCSTKNTFLLSCMEEILRYIRSSRGPACSLMASCCRDSSSRSSCIWSLSCSNSCSRLLVTCMKEWFSAKSVVLYILQEEANLICHQKASFRWELKTNNSYLIFQKSTLYICFLWMQPLCMTEMHQRALKAVGLMVFVVFCSCNASPAALARGSIGVPPSDAAAPPAQPVRPCSHQWDLNMTISENVKCVLSSEHFFAWHWAVNTMLHHYCTALLQFNKHEAARHSYVFLHAKGLGTNISLATDTPIRFFLLKSNIGRSSQS